MINSMKTAISLPDSLFEVAEQTAQYMGVNRSKLVALALEEYINKHHGELVTRKLNEVYEKAANDEFAGDLDAGLNSLRNLTKNDAW